ncbi:MAG: hypothetical protein R2879_19560 [Saprospiraceae bacterium]
MKNKFFIWVNGISNSDSKKKLLKQAGKRISNDINSIRIEFHGDGFNQIGFDEFYYDSEIDIKFDYTKYTVSNTSNKIIEKLYGEQLDSEEINDLVNSEISKHKSFIENKIEEFKKRRNSSTGKPKI